MTSTSTPRFNLARLDPACTLDLFLGDNVYANASAFNYSLHFGGAAVLASSIKKLGELGLAKARPRMGRGAIHGIQTPLSIFGETLSGV